MKTIRFIAYAAIGVLLALMVYIIPREAHAVYGGDFKLQATSGGVVERSKLLGKPYAVFFGFTNCPDLCPTSMQDMSVQLQALGNVAKDFRVYFISIDPARDTLELLKQYVSAFDPRIIGLTGSEPDIAAVVKSFHIFVQKKGEGENYTLDHSSSVLLFDAKGALAGTINASEPDADQMAKLKRVMGG